MDDTSLTGWFRVTNEELLKMLGRALKAGVPMEKLLLGSSELATTTDSSQPQVQEVMPQSLLLKPQQLSHMYQKHLSHHVVVLQNKS